MASKYWIKLYHEILDDPKMGMLSPELWRFTIEIFLLAGEIDCNGSLHGVTKIAWRLRYTTEQIESWLNQLAIETGIVTKDESGWKVTNFEKRQSASDTTERVRQFRERKRKQKSNIQPVTNETNMKRNVTPDTDTDTDIKEVEEAAGFTQISLFYQNEIGPLSPLIRDKLLDMSKSYPANWITQAISCAVDQNVRKLSYVKGTLESWQAIGGPQNDKPKGQYKNGHKPNYSNGRTGHELESEPTVNIYDESSTT